MSDQGPSNHLSSMAPPDPPPPCKTWRGTVVIALVALVFMAVVGMVVYRWAQLQSFSPELHFEGYHRFEGTLLPPLHITASDLIKLRLRTTDGKELVFPPVPEVTTGARTLASIPEGTCVEGYVHLRKGFLSQMMLTVEGKNYLLNGDEDWLITDAGQISEESSPITKNQ